MYLTGIVSCLQPERNFSLCNILMVLCFDCDSSLRTDVKFSTFVIFVLNKFGFWCFIFWLGIQQFSWNSIFLFTKQGLWGMISTEHFFMSSLCCIIHGIIFLVLGYSDMNILSCYGKTKGLLAQGQTGGQHDGCWLFRGCC